MDALVDAGINGEGNWAHSNAKQTLSSSSFWERTNWFRSTRQSTTAWNDCNDAKQQTHRDSSVGLNESLHATSASTSTSASKAFTATHIKSIQNGEANNNPHQQLIDELLPTLSTSTPASNDAIEWEPSMSRKQHTRKHDVSSLSSMQHQHHPQQDTAFTAGDAGMVMNRFTSLRPSVKKSSGLQQLKSIRQLPSLQYVDSRTRQQLEEYIVLPLLQAELFTSLGIKPSCGVIISGSSGIGKTRLLKELIHEMAVYSQQVSASDILSQFEVDAVTAIAGDLQSNRNTVIHKLFNAAMKNAPSVVLIDDIEIIGSLRKTMIMN
jgi:hypothetical protein